VEEAQVHNNPYASIQFNNIPNTYSSVSNVQSSTIKHSNTFNFDNFNHNNNEDFNQSNNYNFSGYNNINTQSRLPHSNTVIQKETNSNKALLEYPDFNNLNQASNNMNAGISFYQQNKETMQQGYIFYQNNQEQINQGVNFCQKNQHTVDNVAKTAMNKPNQGNPSKDKNYDVFQDFFK
jgi:hypothetical protein